MDDTPAKRSVGWASVAAARLTFAVDVAVIRALTAHGRDTAAAGDLAG